MKFAVIAALMSSASAIKMRSSQNAHMKHLCKDMDKCDMSLVQISEEPDHGTGNFNGNIQGTAAEHFGKTKAAIDAENKHILDTQKTCLDFVAQHTDHPQVCNWCHEYAQPASKEIWQWNPEEGVWYKWYD
eukprot:UN16452